MSTTTPKKTKWWLDNFKEVLENFDLEEETKQLGSPILAHACYASVVSIIESLEEQLQEEQNLVV